MAIELPGLGDIVAPMRDAVKEYAVLLCELGGAGVNALTVFGALAAGSFDGSRHTVRSVVVLDKIDLGFLQRLSAEGERLGKSHFAAPLIMTPAYVEDSIDTFPLELIEIQQAHVTVFGPDHFGGLSFEGGHVRLQCERELKVILMGLRQGLLAAAGREEFIGALEVDAAENLVRTMRGMLWFKGDHQARAGADVVGEVEHMTGAAMPGVRAALDPAAAHGWPQFQTLYRDVESLGDIVDAW